MEYSICKIPSSQQIKDCALYFNDSFLIFRDSLLVLDLTITRNGKEWAREEDRALWTTGFIFSKAEISRTCKRDKDQLIFIILLKMQLPYIYLIYFVSLKGGILLFVQERRLL